MNFTPFLLLPLYLTRPEDFTDAMHAPVCFFFETPVDWNR